MKTKRSTLIDTGGQNKSGTKRGMQMRYTAELGKQIGKVYAEGKTTLSGICKLFEMSIASYYKWQKDYPEFKEIIIKAEKKRRENMFDIAMTNIQTRTEWTEVTETETEYTHKESFDEKTKKTTYLPVPKKTIKKTKMYPPSDAALIFVAVNCDPKKELRSVNQASLKENTTLTDKIVITEEHFK